MLHSIKKTAFVMATSCSVSIAVAQTTATEWYNEGQQLFEGKKYEEAVRAFDKAAGLNAQYDAAFYKAGWCYNDLEQYDNAVDRLQKAIAIRNTHA